jgi:hypothetical protein
MIKKKTGINLLYTGITILFILSAQNKFHSANALTHTSNIFIRNIVSQQSTEMFLQQSSNFFLLSKLISETFSGLLVRTRVLSWKLLTILNSCFTIIAQLLRNKWFRCVLDLTV